MNEKFIKEAVNHFGKMSDGDLVAQLGKLMAAERAKDGGANIARVIGQIKPLLNAEQRKRLDDVLESVGS